MKKVFLFNKETSNLTGDIENSQVVLDLTTLNNTDSFMFPQIVPTADTPFTNTKTYTVFYGTDHGNETTGKLAWGQMNNLDFSDFEEGGVILNEHQSETPRVIIIGSTVHLYYHTFSTDPNNGGKQVTHRMYTTGGNLPHLASWTFDYDVLGIGDFTHNGYFNPTQLTDGSYRGYTITAGGTPQQYVPWHSTDAINWTYGNIINHSVLLTGVQTYKMYTGGYVDYNGHKFWIGNIVDEDHLGNTYFALVKVDQYLQVERFCKFLNSGTGIPEIALQAEGMLDIYDDGSTVHLYWKRGTNLNYATYNKANLAEYATDTTHINTSNILAAYNFNNDLTDETGTNNGTDVGGVTYESVTLETGVSANALKTGAGKYVDTARLVEGLGAFTVSIYVKLGETWTQNMYTNWSNPYIINIRYVNKSLLFNFRVGEVNYPDYFGTQELPSVNFRQLDLVYDGTEKTLYINGKKDDNIYAVTGVVDDLGTIKDRIGDGSDSSFGVVRVFNKALTEAEVNEQYIKNNRNETLI